MPVLRQLTTMLLLLFCLFPIGQPLGTVLCFGADGHIALEPVHDRAHGTASLAAQGLLYQHVATPRAGAEHAGPCVDLFFASEGGAQLIAASDTCPKPETPVFVPVLIIVPASTEVPAPSIPPDHSLSSHHSLTILRSVVLHI